MIERRTAQFMDLRWAASLGVLDRQRTTASHPLTSSSVDYQHGSGQAGSTDGFVVRICLDGVALIVVVRHRRLASMPTLAPSSAEKTMGLSPLDPSLSGGFSLRR
jgi:hypothetical protein